MKLKKNYRPDIDGLRGLAVLVVILFHYQVGLFSGGYIGVDVFFVISGYLITGILLSQCEQGTFNYLSFLKKRFFRLYPALAFSVLLSVLAGIWLFTPNHLEKLAQDSFGVLGFFSNITYWKDIGYFAILEGYKPFVPTWSLSVEWQFYMIWPVFIFLSHRFFKPHLKWLLVLSVLGPVILSELLLSHYSNFIYYNVPFRIFEFGIGALCLFGEDLFPKQQGHWKNDVSLLSGFAGILLSVFLFDNQTKFPGLHALLPCISAALVILSANTSRFSPLLSNRAVNYIGRISYSLYLVHWPIYVFAGYYFFVDFLLWQKIGLIVLSGLLASFMYHFVENRYRYSKQRTKLWNVIGAGVLVLSLTGIIIIDRSEGIIGQLSEKEQAFLQTVRTENRQYQESFGARYPEHEGDVFDLAKHAGAECTLDNTKNPALVLDCLEGNLGERGGYLVVGDSNAGNIYQALRQAFPQKHFALLNESGCAAAEYLADGRSGRWCFKGMTDIMVKLSAQARIKGVVLASRQVLQPYEDTKATISKVRALDLPVMLIGPTPMLRQDTFTTYFQLREKEEAEQISLPIEYPYFYAQDIHQIEAWGASLEGENLYHFSRVGALCPQRTCPLLVPGTDSPLFIDTQHLSRAALKMMAEKMVEDRTFKMFLRR